jgi:NMD protein affecting ribosome stability and mRNA decay
MKQSNLGERPRNTRRIAGHAQQDHVLDPYQAQQKPAEGTVCPQCGVTFLDGRWRWGKAKESAPRERCAACRRISDNFPAGIVTLRGEFAKDRTEQLIQLARHQEEAEKGEHPLNRIISIEADAQGLVIKTTDIHLPHRIAEAIRHAFHGTLETNFDPDGYFVRVNWSPPS